MARDELDGDSSAGGVVVTRPRAATVLRRFLDGESLRSLALSIVDDRRDTSWLHALTHVEQCIRRGLRGEVRIPKPRRRRPR